MHRLSLLPFIVSENEQSSDHEHQQAAQNHVRAVIGEAGIFASGRARLGRGLVGAAYKVQGNRTELIKPFIYRAVVVLPLKELKKRDEMMSNFIETFQAQMAEEKQSELGFLKVLGSSGLD